MGVDLVNAMALTFFDDYGIRVKGRSAPEQTGSEQRWRRPTLVEGAGAVKGCDNVLMREARAFAANLKTLLLFVPHVYTDWFWLLHNPHMLVLNSLPPDDKDWIGRFLHSEQAHKFFCTCRTDDPKAPQSDSDAVKRIHEWEPSFPGSPSWLHDAALHRRSEAEAWQTLSTALRDYAPVLHFPTTQFEHPGVTAKQWYDEYIGEMRAVLENNDPADIACTPDEPAEKRALSVALLLLEEFSKRDLRFSMSKAREELLPEILALPNVKPFIDKNLWRVEWELRERVYLRAFAESGVGGVSTRSPLAGCVFRHSTVSFPEAGRSGVKEAEFFENFDVLEDLVPNVSFQTITNIRSMPAFDEYENGLKSASLEHAPQRAWDLVLSALYKYISDMAPYLVHYKTGAPVLPEKTLWQGFRWLQVHPVLLTVPAPLAGGVSAAVAVAGAPLVVGMVLGALSGGILFPIAFLTRLGPLRRWHGRNLIVAGHAALQRGGE